MFQSKRLAHADRLQVADEMRRVAYAPQQVIFSRGDPGIEVFLVVEGSVRLVGETDHAGATTTMGYDANGNVIRTTKANGNQVLKGYDGANRVVSLTDAIGNIATIEYDNEDQITATVTPLGRRTTYTYDNRGQMTSMTDPVSGVSRFTYDNRGNLLSSQDERGHTTTYAYDELYRLVSMRDPLSASKTPSSITPDVWITAVRGCSLPIPLSSSLSAPRSLTSHGTLYKALARLVVGGLLADELEDPDIALREGRPRRRLYRITGAGQRRVLEERRRVAAPGRRAAFA